LAIPSPENGRSVPATDRPLHMHLEILVEEPSAEILLDGLLPKDRARDCGAGAGLLGIVGYGSSGSDSP